MSEISVPYTCSFIDEVLDNLRMIETADTSASVLECLARIGALMEDLRYMNADLRDEGEVFAEQSDIYERQVEEWQEIAHNDELKIAVLERKLFDAEKEIDRWRGYSKTPTNLLIGSL